MGENHTGNWFRFPLDQHASISQAEVYTDQYLHLKLVILITLPFSLLVLSYFNLIPCLDVVPCFTLPYLDYLIGFCYRTYLILS